MCRSEAEKDTWLHLLRQGLLQQYRNKISATLRHALFFRQRTFIEEVSFSPDIHVYFSLASLFPGPFHLRIEVEDRPLTNHKSFMISRSFALSWPLRGIPKGTEVRIILDECLVYAGTIREMAEKA